MPVCTFSQKVHQILYLMGNEAIFFSKMKVVNRRRVKKMLIINEKNRDNLKLNQN